ncbi:MAG: hypothetical protein HOV78_25370 [Hamadaea sp.]|nr:hypothetical protein [Hamadaea sp.]
MTSVIVTVGLAFVGYLMTYLNGLRLAQRQARLARINQQLSDLYGPLFALIEANLRIYDAFLAKHGRPDGRSPFDGEAPATEEALAGWRTWATTAFIPNIRAMRDVVVARADLLIEEQMPAVLLQLCAHVSGYEITAGRWAEGDYDERTSVVAWPGKELRLYISERFTHLKSEQARLLGGAPSLGKRTGRFNMSSAG